MNQVSWKFWVGLLAAVVAFGLLGIPFGKTAPDNLLFDIAAVGVCAASLLFVAIYTALGFTKSPVKWWRSEMGTFLILSVASQFLVTGVPAFAVIFHHGLIDTEWWAWTWIGAHFLSAAMLVGLIIMWLNSYRAGRQNGNGKDRNGVN